MLMSVVTVQSWATDLFVFCLHACACLADPILAWADGKFHLSKAEKWKRQSPQGCGVSLVASALSWSSSPFWGLLVLLQLHPQLLCSSSPSSLLLSYIHIWSKLSLIFCLSENKRIMHRRLKLFPFRLLFLFFLLCSSTLSEFINLLTQ